MKKFNVGGLVLFASIWVLAFFRKRYGAPFDVSLLAVPIVLISIGLVVAGIDRWIGDSKYGVFPVSLAWLGYWGFVAFLELFIAGLWAFGANSGHGGVAEHQSA